MVNEGVVLASELDEQMAAVMQRLKQAGQELPPQSVLRTQVLERLILQEIQMQRATRAGIRVNDEQLNQALADVAALKPADIRAYMAARRLDGIGSRSLMRGLAAIRSALRYLEREGLADASALSAVRGPKLARGLPKPLPAAAARRPLGLPLPVSQCRASPQPAGASPPARRLRAAGRLRAPAGTRGPARQGTPAA